MIIMKLVGGLGNQMFQYALGRHLAEIHTTELKLDISWFQKKIRQYELKYFNITGGSATDEEIKNVRRLSTRLTDRYHRNIKDKILPYYLRTQIVEKSPEYDDQILNVPESAYLIGYWQSEKYFATIQDIIRKEFTFRYPLDPVNQNVANHIQNCTSVSIHIRRGDYVSNPEYNHYFGTCSIDYYQSAITFMKRAVPGAHFFLFSDEPDWAYQNLIIGSDTTFISHNTGENSYRDMQLMSLCKHNIIANSTFSWWGAWLNANPVKIVVTPQKWFNDARRYPKDLVPENWIRL